MNAWLPVAAYVALIFTLSSIPALAPPGGMIHADKAAHVVEYAVLGALLARAAGGRTGGPRRAATAIVLGALVAALDELFQGTTGRETSGFDWLADVAGAAAGAAADAWLRRREVGRRWWTIPASGERSERA